MHFKRSLSYLSIVVVLLIIGISGATWLAFRSPFASLQHVKMEATHLQIMDRHNQPLALSFSERWNTHDVVPYHAIPALLQQAFILSEDKRFFRHHGVDWQARLHAVAQYLHPFHSTHRGSSTLTEQVVRMLHPRPRTLWSKWIEGIEAITLERRISKADILEFYLNQVPFTANRHGVSQAARFYFNRALDTLSPKEMLALAILVRAPSAFDLRKAQVSIDPAILRLGTALQTTGFLSPEILHKLPNAPLSLDLSAPSIIAYHFADFVRKNSTDTLLNQGVLHTTLDGDLQNLVQTLLLERLQALKAKNVHQAAALVVDHTTGHIRAWVSIGEACLATAFTAPGCYIDMVTTPRQPGSSLKPFLYAAALEKGWTPSTLIEDTPYAQAIGKGLHRFHNYSHQYYGTVPLRQALGSSLNIPALHTIHYVTPARYLQVLHQLSFQSLDQPASFYDDGLALGDGEVTLFEQVQAYMALAHFGIFRPLLFTPESRATRATTKVFSEPVASRIGYILSDPWARYLEFDIHSILNLPVQTAMKTGTSTDYHDAWVIGYNYRYVVGIWMGNVDQTPMDGVTGVTGPALVARSIFHELTRNDTTYPLYFSPSLQPEEETSAMTEYPQPADTLPSPTATYVITQPNEGLALAYDPRIPQELQALMMKIQGTKDTEEVAWIVDDMLVHKANTAQYLWPISRGKHVVKAAIYRQGQATHTTPSVHFTVK